MRLRLRLRLYVYVKTSLLTAQKAYFQPIRGVARPSDNCKQMTIT